MKRKNPVFISAVFAAIITFALCLAACPDFSDDDDSGGSAYYWKPSTDWIDKSLSDDKWLGILSDIEKRGRKVRLDLSDCLISSSAHIMQNISDLDGNITVYGSGRYIVFNPTHPDLVKKPSAIAGQKLIESIILPDRASLIRNSLPYNYTYTGEIDAKDVKEFKEAADFRYFTSLRSISGKNIAFIGNFAFIDNKILEEVNFPNAHHITQGAFYGCTSIRKLSFPFARDNIGIRAFEGCTNLRSVYIPDLPRIDALAFKNCKSLTRADFPLAEEIDKEAFSGCTSLTEVIFPKVTRVQDSAFRDCVKLEIAAFWAKPDRAGTGEPIKNSPDTGYIPIGSQTNPSVNYYIDSGSVIFYPNAFRGCKSLQELDIRYAWNVYFCYSVLADIGESLTFILWDDEGPHAEPPYADPPLPVPPVTGDCYGHPQTDLYLGGGGPGRGEVTLKKITFFLPGVGATIGVVDSDAAFPPYYNPSVPRPPGTIKAYSGIKHDINGRYNDRLKSGIDLSVLRRSPGP